MPLYMGSSLSSQPATPHRSLNFMRSLSLCRKSRPTCTLSLAHVSACKVPPPSSEAMQVDSIELDLNTVVHFVAVPMPQPKSVRPTKTKKTTTTTTTTRSNDINVIPFPTSAQTTTTTPTNSSKRQQGQKKERSERPSTPTPPSSISPPRKRARKGTPSPPPSSSRSTPSARVRALAQRAPPARPPTPTPDSRSRHADDKMETQEETGDKSELQPSSEDDNAQRPTLELELSDSSHPSQGEQKQDIDKHGQTALPPYSPSPPPYSPLVVAPTPMPVISSPTPIPLQSPIVIIPLTNESSSPISSSVSSPTSPTNSTPQPRPVPLSSPPPPTPPPSPQQRKPRISPSDLKFFIILYRTLVFGLEMRQRNRLNTQVRRARDGSRREQHLDGVLIEVDDDDDDDDDERVANDVDVDAMTDSTSGNESTYLSLNEDLEAQDALLALRLRGFLKWNGVDEWVLKVDSSSVSEKTINPFLEDDDVGMDVDIQQQQQQPPILSSRHLITMLRMRGTCGPRQGQPGLGMMRGGRRDKSNLRNEL